MRFKDEQLIDIAMIIFGLIFMFGMWLLISDTTEKKHIERMAEITSNCQEQEQL